MKRILFLISFIILPLLLFCQSDEFKFTRDTLKLNFKGKAGHFTFMKGKYYIHVHEESAIYCITMDGDVCYKVTIPSRTNPLSYYDFHVENDTLFLAYKYDEDCYYLNEDSLLFYPIKSRYFTIYQDSLYNVYSVCMGEWGSRSYFQDRNNRIGLEVDIISSYPLIKRRINNEYIVYEVSTPCPFIVNRINNEYYLTEYYKSRSCKEFSYLYKITDPHKMARSKLDFTSRKTYFYYSGIETIFDNSTVDQYNPLHIHTSFVNNNKLHHLYTNDAGIFIGKIENSTLVPLYQFEYRLKPSFIRQINEREQVLSFTIEDSGDKGMLLISENNFKFYIFTQ